MKKQNVYRCSHGAYNSRCKADATHWLIQPDGQKNPGGWVCFAHGSEIAQEYRDKLNEPWSVVPIDAAGVISRWLEKEMILAR